jgi:hypothetical protein
MTKANQLSASRQGNNRFESIAGRSDQSLEIHIGRPVATRRQLGRVRRPLGRVEMGGLLNGVGIHRLESINSRLRHFWV